MTATTTTARATLAEVIAAATGPLGGVYVADHEPDAGKVLGATAVVVSHEARERHMDRYTVRVELDPTKHAAAQLADRSELVTETVDIALESALPATWHTGTWTWGFERDAALYVSRCELQLPTADPTPGATHTAVAGTLGMTTARSAIAAAAATALEDFRPKATIYGYPTWPGLAVAPVAAVVSPLGLARDMGWHQFAVLIGSAIPADQAQDWLGDLVWQLDDGLRSLLPSGYFFAGPGTDEETGWDRAGWVDELECWAAQVAVGHYR